MKIHLTVGDAVYESYAPLKYGKVISERIVDPSGRMLTIRWKDGTESEVRDLRLRSLSQLTDDTERKARTHAENLRKALDL